MSERDRMYTPPDAADPPGAFDLRSAVVSHLEAIPTPIVDRCQWCDRALDGDSAELALGDRICGDCASHVRGVRVRRQIDGRRRRRARAELER